MRFIKGLIKFLIGILIATGLILALGYFVFLPKFEESAKQEFFGNKDQINFLLVGKESATTLEDHDVDGPSHSDTIMVATIYPKTNKIKLTSIPRDTYFKYLPNSKKKNQKINAAFFLGGIDETIDVVEKFLDIKIDKYMVVDYNLIIKFIDAIGGIDINWKYDDYHYEDHWTVPTLIIDLKHGINHLDGKNAVSYLRTRKAYKNQDLERIQAQQEFLVQLYNELKDPSNIFLAPELIRIVEENTDTNIDKKEMIFLAYYGFKYVDMDEIKIRTLKGHDKKIDGIWYYVVDEKEAQSLMRDDD